MAITLTIGKQLPSKPRNVYVLHVRSMSGDADSYRAREEIFEFVKIDELKNKIRICIAICNLPWNSGCSDITVEHTLRSLNIASLTTDEVVEWYSDMVGYDAIGNCQATLDRFWVTFTDNDGIDFEVEIALSDEDGSSKSTYGFGRGKKL